MNVIEKRTLEPGGMMSIARQQYRVIIVDKVGTDQIETTLIATDWKDVPVTGIPEEETHG